MLWSVVGDVLVVVHGEHPPSDDEWDSWLRERAIRAPHVRALVIYSAGGGPSTAQRKKLLEDIARMKSVPQTALLTSSAVVRGLLTAMSWFTPLNRRVKVFRENELDPACAYLGLNDTLRDGIRAEIPRLMARMQTPSSAPVRVAK